MYIVSHISLAYSESVKQGEKRWCEDVNARTEDRKKTAGIFRIMAEFYKPPSEEFWIGLKEEQLFGSLRQAAMDAYGSTALMSALKMPESYEQLVDIYSATLSNTKEGAALPVESIYKIWTQDEGCTLPFAKSKGYLQGDPAFHIRFILEKFQIEIPPEYAGTPDHLSILLELFSYFIEHAQEEFTRGFLADHFDWLPDFKEKVRKTGVHPFYYQATGLLMELLELQRQTYR